MGKRLRQGRQARVVRRYQDIIQGDEEDEAESSLSDCHKGASDAEYVPNSASSSGLYEYKSKSAVKSVRPQKSELSLTRSADAAKKSAPSQQISQDSRTKPSHVATTVNKSHVYKSSKQQRSQTLANDTGNQPGRTAAITSTSPTAEDEESKSQKEHRPALKKNVSTKHCHTEAASVFSVMDDGKVKQPCEPQYGRPPTRMARKLAGEPLDSDGKPLPVPIIPDFPDTFTIPESSVNAGSISSETKQVAKKMKRKPEQQLPEEFEAAQILCRLQGRELVTLDWETSYERTPIR